MMGIKDELIKATTEWSVVKVLNEAEALGINDIAATLGTSKQIIYRHLVKGMTKMYKSVKKETKATPAQAMKILMDFLNADAEEVLSYLDKDAKAEVTEYVKDHGAY